MGNTMSQSIKASTAHINTYGDAGLHHSFCKCRYCSYYFKKSDLKSHEDSCTYKQSTPGLDASTRIPLGFKGLKTIKNHRKDTRFPCTMCSKSYVSKQGLSAHINSAHTKLESFSCTLCDKSFSVKQILIGHMKDVHYKLKPFSCTLCEKSFPRKETLNIHMDIVHRKLRAFSCTLCNRSFSRKKYLTFHMKYHEGDKSYSCSICKKRFKVKQSVDKHVDSVHRKIRFSCKICRKQFVCKQSLNHHIDGQHQKNDSYTRSENATRVVRAATCSTAQNNTEGIAVSKERNNHSGKRNSNYAPDSCGKCMMCLQVFPQTQIEKHLWSCQAKLPCLTRIVEIKTELEEEFPSQQEDNKEIKTTNTDRQDENIQIKVEPIFQQSHND